MDVNQSHQMSRHVTDIILQSISDGVFTVDHKWRITSFNRAAEAITGVRRDEALGKYCWEVFRSNMCETDCALRRTMKQGKPFVDTSTYFINSDKHRIPVVVSTSLLKDTDGTVLGGVETFRDMSIVEALRKELHGRFQIGDMVSRSQSMHKIFTILPQIAESDSTVLVQGETGTGKELLARAVHNLSSRRDKPFVAINCGALPDTLLESELFGYKAGAFTHAVKDKPGSFAIAEGGTIFLDEIGDVSPAFQTRLLRVLEEGEFQPLGGVKTIKANIRVIAAANKDLPTLVENGQFREDLYYRINVIRLTLPPLRDRKEDIPLLIHRFIAKMNTIRGRAVTGIDKKALEPLMSHNYPGNIRELENIIEHAFVLCANGIILPQHLPDGFISQTPTSADHNNFGSELKSAEARVILDALKRNNYSRLAAAHDLGLHKSTLFRKIKKLGITLPKIDGRSASH
jgi:PAS domain S-box-containing protein